MKQTTITIADKTAGIAYCYATEIAFSDLSGNNIEDFIQGIASGIAPSQKTILYLIIAATMAYSQAKGEEPAVRDTDIMYNSKPQEIIDALTEVLKLRSEWYDMPAGAEPKKNKKEAQEKNS